MRILISPKEMSSLSGSPLYHYTLAKELKKQGHGVDFYSLWGDYYKDLDSVGITRYYLPEFKGEYDLVLISQPQSKDLLDKVRAKKIINIIHSEYDCETPIIDHRITHYIAIRPSIKEHLIKYHNIPENMITVIYNGVDCERFNPSKRKKHEGNYIKYTLPCTLDMLRIKFIEHYTKQATNKKRVFLIGKSYGNQFFTNEYCDYHKEVEDIENYIGDADFIAGILLGRVNLEARAMGIPSYIHDPENPKDFYLFNPSDEEFFKNHDIKNVAKQIINLTNNLCC